MSLRTLFRQFQTYDDFILFTSCSDFLSRHMAGMANARRKAIAEKRRRGVRPYCRKRTLTPRTIQQVAQVLGAGPTELNPDFSATLPAPIQKAKRGAPVGNTNRLVHEKCARTSVDLRARVRAHLCETRVLITATCKLLRGDPQSIAWFEDIREVPGDAK